MTTPFVRPYSLAAFHTTEVRDCQTGRTGIVAMVQGIGNRHLDVIEHACSGSWHEVLRTVPARASLVLRWVSEQIPDRNMQRLRQDLNGIE
ncbi:MAG: hypothetical protein KF871_04785 [Hydrogenophaga sp.]|uniref:hypothetical protein n=1 Tax=Hydrogenophaga sp. TaxID=1904254 RepID=UPI001D55A775|nr:hypothetical protein [Hydrogenophaga sp.]MBX3609190.1 hypothetical protein [Hydrogenophaga sp.]